MKKFLLLLVVNLCISLHNTPGIAQLVSRHPGNGLPATDALQRTLSMHAETGDIKSDKFVAIFYWNWHKGWDDTTQTVKNISQILIKHPEALKIYDHPAWGTLKPGRFFWGEPLFGYYQSADPWVLRKHAEMLSDAGIDVIFLDDTGEGHQYATKELFEEWEKALKQGVNPPKIAFMLEFTASKRSLHTIRKIYRQIYKPGRYKDLWFYWKGKPLVMAYPDNLTDSPEDREIREFFTFRPGQPDYVKGPQRNDQWAWLENYPLHGYVKKEDGRYEQAAVGIAQNASFESRGMCCAFNIPGTFGRSYSHKKGVDPRVDGYLRGYNFSEQWEAALEIDPEMVFVTGWNEYTVEMLLPQSIWTGWPFSFVDQFDWDRSRDIEPNNEWGDKGDVYYYQLIDYVRKFKGTLPTPKASSSKSIKIGSCNDWEGVAPHYKHYRGNTVHRNHRGYFNRIYINNTGRNDLVAAKVARDNRHLYFYVETAEKLTPKSDRNWMMLFIDADNNPFTGWNGYDYVINRITPGEKAIIEKNRNGWWSWEKVGDVPYAVKGNKLEIKVAKILMEMEGKPVKFQFKWSDNMQDEGNIMDFYLNGDTMPGGRFNYLYEE
ncbi:glycoside hydrolase family 71/99 protein [Petrimonas mucosa]|jgi:hypothetical protein|uniref:Uncharacterized protein n=1 Tax=Petrimonas mucosa TaxID=1642646 RepID=A0A1G4G3U0_9BACT|nr:hypothetical protein [Petrimonas mucosa]SCM55427.1 putative protein {ECO:0000313/EMBL:CDD12104,1} [Petrimonas mucosa]SFU60553.1 hypothetical protein SAMN05216364_10353 [Porphyromonadaceae bacterium KHP3R9]